MKLYEITDAINDIVSIDPEFLTEEVFDAIQKELCSMDRNEKILQIAKIIMNYNSDINAIKMEEKRLKAKRETLARKVDFLKNYIKNNVDVEESITDGITKISFLKSESTYISNEEELPEDFITKKTIPSPNKKKIKEAIKNGEEVAGAELVTNYNVQVK